MTARSLRALFEPISDSSARRFLVVLLLTPTCTLALSGLWGLTKGYKVVWVDSGANAAEFSIVQSVCIPAVLLAYTIGSRVLPGPIVNATHVPFALLSVAATFGISAESADVGASSQAYLLLPIAFAACSFRLWGAVLITAAGIVAQACLMFMFLPPSTAIIAAAAFSAIAVSLMWLIVCGNHRAHAAHESLRNLARFDGLTGLPTRPTFDEVLRRWLHTGNGIAVLVIDVDTFKQINDVHGHLAGDCVLKALGVALPRALPPGSLVCRVGGDEFVTAVRCDSPHEALAVAEHLCEVVRGLRVPWHAELLRFTISVGVTWTCTATDNSAAAYAAADAALLQCKAAGRDGAQLAEPTASLGSGTDEDRTVISTSSR